jgi:hypothetical protein
MYEATYVVDSSVRRRVVVDWFWHENGGLITYSTVLVISVLVMVFSSSLRLPAAAVFGFVLTYYLGLIRSLTDAARQDPREQTVRLDGGALEIRTPDSEARYQWSAVARVSVTRRFVFVTVAARPLALPREAFSTEAVAYLVDASRAAGAKVSGT